MSFEIFVYLTWGVQILSLILLGVIFYSLLFMILRWRTPRRRAHATTLLVSVFAIVLSIGAHIALLTWGLAAVGRQQMAEHEAFRESRNQHASFVRTGDPAPEFSVTDIDGQEFALADARGKVVLINFFATWCGPCLMELPHIQKIWEEHGDDESFELLVIGREETGESVTQFRTKNGYTFPMAADPDREIYGNFAKELIPRTILVAADGTILFSKSGFYEEDLVQLKRLLHEVLNSAE